MEKTPADVLEEAADLLLIHGRCRHKKVDAQGRHCVMGALGEAATGWAECHPSADVLAALAAAIPPAPFVQCDYQPVQIMLWSDRTEDDYEVIDTLRAVAKDLRNEAS